VLVMQLALEAPFERAFAATDPLLSTISFE
jgi:hypothetical protein